MDTKSKNNDKIFKSLASKIAVSYLFLLVMALLAVGIAFNSLIRDYLLQDAQRSLLDEARSMAGILARGPKVRAFPGEFGEFQVDKPLFRMSSRFVEGQYIITDENLVVSESSMEMYPAGSRLAGPIADKLAEHGVKKGESLRFSTRDSVVVAVPVMDRPPSEIKGMVVLLTSLEDLRLISERIVRLLLITLGTAGFLVIVLSLLLAKGITKPLRILRDSIQGIAARDFSGRVDIHTGDEMEELGAAFNLMAGRLEEYDAAQQRLIQNASHELKTPLMSIQGYAEAIRDGVVEQSEVNKGLGVIIRESQRLKKLVEDIIYLSKLESFEEEYQFAPIELEELLHEALESMAGFSRSRDIELDFVHDSSTPVSADGEKLLRVFVNILSNAIKNAEHRVAVEIKPKEEGVDVVFEDDGEGFSSRDLERLFERFYKGQGEGSGLGMTIARAIVQRHGGDIHASNGEKGARIQLSLPVLNPGSTGEPDGG